MSEYPKLGHTICYSVYFNVRENPSFGDIAHALAINSNSDLSTRYQIYDQVTYTTPMHEVLNNVVGNFLSARLLDVEYGR